MNAANILKPALSRGEIQVIGATTLTEYRKYIEKDSALERRFQPVMVEEPSIDETRLQDVSGLYDEPEAKPARRRKAGTTRRTTRKKASDEPQEELNSPAFDNFEGVDFDS